MIANPVWETAWILPELPPRGATEFDPTPTALAIEEDGGGSALNTACALSCAGRRVVAVGRVGDDRQGRAAIAALERRGVTARIQIAAGRTTKRNHLYVGAGDRSVAFRAFLPPACVPAAWGEGPREVAQARILLLDRLSAESVGLLRARPRPRLLNALNRNSPSFRGPAIERFREAMPHLDYLQLSEGAAEPRPLDGASALPPVPEVREAIHSPIQGPPLDAEAVAALLRAGVRIIARTRGPLGVIVHREGHDPATIPAARTDVVDPTGAGDAFAAGFLDGLLDGVDIVEAARRGVDWGARACRHLGARGWLDREPPERH